MPIPICLKNKLGLISTFLAAVMLSGCASPTFYMPTAQIVSLGDDELCRYKNNYRDETKLEAEIARRNLNCDPYYRQCLVQGNLPGTQAMDFCTDILRENRRLRYTEPYSRFDVFGYSDYDRLRSVRN